MVFTIHDWFRGEDSGFRLAYHQIFFVPSTLHLKPSLDALRLRSDGIHSRKILSLLKAPSSVVELVYVEVSERLRQDRLQVFGDPPGSDL